MTSITLPVSQEARNHAADLLSSQGKAIAAFNVRSGNCDEVFGIHPFVEAFAKFETQIRNATLAEAAGALKLAEDALRPFAGIADFGKRGGDFVIANAIYSDMTGRLSAPRQSHWHWTDFERAREAEATIRQLRERGA